MGSIYMDFNGNKNGFTISNATLTVSASSLIYLLQASRYEESDSEDDDINGYDESDAENDADDNRPKKSHKKGQKRKKVNIPVIQKFFVSIVGH